MRCLKVFHAKLFPIIWPSKHCTTVTSPRIWNHINNRIFHLPLINGLHITNEICSEFHNFSDTCTFKCFLDGLRKTIHIRSKAIRLKITINAIRNRLFKGLCPTNGNSGPINHLCRGEILNRRWHHVFTNLRNIRRVRLAIFNIPCSFVSHTNPKRPR